MTYTVIPWHRERENHVLGRETCGFHPLILVSCNLLCSHKREREFWSCVNQLCWRERTILVFCRLALQERERKSCMNQLCRREKDFGRVNQICRRENKILVLCELALQERESGERNFGQLYRLELRERGRERRQMYLWIPPLHLGLMFFLSLTRRTSGSIPQEK